MNAMRAIDFGRDLSLIAPQIAVALTGVAALTAEMVRRARAALWLTVIGLLVATGLAVPLVGSDTTVFLGTYRIDDLSVWATLILCPATALAAVLAVTEVRGTDREGSVYTLFPLTTIGALALAGAGDAMFLVLGVLISSLGSFGLVAYPRDTRATEAAMKYFVFGSVTSAIMIFGLTYWFAAGGSTVFTALRSLSGMRIALAGGLVAVLVGLGYKAAVAPFHFWAPDAYDGGPISVAAYLSVVPKIGAIFGLAQVVRDLPAEISVWRIVVALLAVLSMTYGNLAALPQRNVVRLLAYSSVAQAGYFLLGVVAVGRGALAIQSLVVFAAAYAAMNLGAFAVTLHTGRDLAAFDGLGRRHPWMGSAMVVFLLSLVGVPPLAGFAGKLLLFGAALNAGFLWLAIIAIANSVLSLAVYLRIIVPLFGQPRPLQRSRATTAVVWSVALVLTVALGLGAQAVLSQVG